MKKLKKFRSEKRANYGVLGLKKAVDRLAELGWCCVLQRPPEGLLVGWEIRAYPFLRLCGWDENDAKRQHCGTSILPLFLDLLALGAPPHTAAGLVTSKSGQAWAAELLSELGRGRYQPVWWSKEMPWHEGLRNGVLPVPLFRETAEEGLLQIVHRLAEFGWLDLESCEAYVAGSWHEDVVPLVSLMISARGAGENPPEAGDQGMQAAGRLSLLLQLKLMRIPGDLAAKVAGGGEETDAWVSSLAYGVCRGFRPLWWDRKPCWHKAVRQALGEQAQECGLRAS